LSLVIFPRSIPYLPVSSALISPVQTIRQSLLPTPPDNVLTNSPAGFVYQRLALDKQAMGFCLHGLNALWLPDVGWYRIDARGNRDDLRAGFDPPREHLPFACVVPGEQLFSEVWAEPLRRVVDALRRHATRGEFEANLPDATDDDLKSERTGCVVVLEKPSNTCLNLSANSSGRLTGQNRGAPG